MIGKPNHTCIFNDRPEQRMGLQQHSVSFCPGSGCRWKTGEAYFSQKVYRSAQNPANRGTADLQPSGDFGFADAGAAQLLDLRSVYGRSCRTTQPFAVFPCMSQASLGPFPQNLSF